jgi:mannitol/fructose-specific phosphotransferase system IIA component (Ntr-type)
MKALLAALEQERLIELREKDKEKALRDLAVLLTPPADAGFVEAILARERAGGTALGMGWACPHARTAGEGELLCAVGFFPDGLDYGAGDGRPVKLVAMYHIPDDQKNTYLKEISVLARAVSNLEGKPGPEAGGTLETTRRGLMELASKTMENGSAETARMIRPDEK